MLSNCRGSMLKLSGIWLNSAIHTKNEVARGGINVRKYVLDADINSTLTPYQDRFDKNVINPASIRSPFSIHPTNDPKQSRAIQTGGQKSRKERC